MDIETPGATSLSKLVRAAQQGNREAYDGIVRRFQRMAIVYAGSILGNTHNAEDAAQESFVEAFLHLASLKDPNAFPGWFRTIIYRQCVRTVRGEVGDTVSYHLASGTPAEKSDPVQVAEESERRAEIAREVAQLAEPERLAVVMYYFGQYSVAEVATFLSLPSNTIKKRLQSARRKLKKRIIHLMPEAIETTTESAAFTSHIREMLEAALSGDATTVRTLLDIDPKLANVVDSDYATPLHNTVESNNVEIAEALIAAGADINAKYKQTGHTPLSWAVTYGSFDVAHALLRGGAILDLWCAAGMGNLEATRSFWDAHGRLADHPSTTGSSRFDAQGRLLPRPPATPEEVLGDALYIAARNGHTEVVRFLLEHGADVHFRGFCGGTPLHWAYFANSKPVVDLLLAHGADPESLDDDQQATPRAFGVLEATSFGIVNLLRAILAADPTLVSCQGRNGTPLDIARKNGYEEIITLLESVGLAEII